MNKLQEKITVGELKIGDVIGTRSSSEWPYGAKIGEIVRDDDGPRHLMDRNGHPIGDRPFFLDEDVWVERDHLPIKVECPNCGEGLPFTPQPEEKNRARQLVDVLASYAQTTRQEDEVAQIFTPLFEAGIEEKKIEGMAVGMISDGLRWGNWPWVLTDTEKQVRP